jgi:hypothetical protein
MSRSAPARPPRSGSTRRRRQREQRRPWVGYAAAAIVLVLAVFVAARLLIGSNQPAPADMPVSPELMTTLTTVPVDVLNQVGRGTVTNPPQPIHGQPVAMSDGGLPLVTYIGAEWCPYCAGERWPMIIALSRFGTFDNISTSASSSSDVYPSTPTFTFHGSTYTSPYITFAPVETQSNVRAGNGFQAQDTPTSAQESLIETYDAPPYVPAQSAGSIPFVDFANQYMISGASYDVGVLQGQTREQIAADLSNPSSPQAQAILGSANAITAAICATTNNQPAEVCTQPGVTAFAPSAASASPTSAPSQ